MSASSPSASRGPTWPDPSFGDDPFGDPPWPEQGGDGELLAGVRRALATGIEPPGLAELARALGRDRPLAGDPSPLPVAEILPTEAELVRVAADHDPGVVAEGGDRVLGPWAIDAAPDVLRAAVAVAAFLVGEDADVSPVDRWIRESSPSKAKTGFLAARAAPLLPYRVRPAGPGRATVEPLLPQGASAPTGDLPWPEVPCPAGGSGEVVVARIARTATGWARVAGLGLPSWPAGAARQVRWLSWTLPRPTTEDLGRRHGHVLLRLALREAWREG